MQPKIIEFFEKFIARELGIIYGESNRFQLVNRLEEITKTLSLKDVEALYQMAQETLPGDVKQLILDIATNNETSFFRDSKIFTAVQEHVLPALFSAMKDGQKPRILSAACSCGQEPYTLAMLLTEYGRSIKTTPNAEIIATDISSRALERAKSGRFSQFEVQRGLSTALLAAHFDKDGENYWTIKPEIRKMVQFQNLNLLAPFDHLGQFDLIFCRNVLIYQPVENKAGIIKKLTRHLKPAGHFVLGAGESLIGLTEDFESIRSDSAILYRLKPAPQRNAA